MVTPQPDDPSQFDLEIDLDLISNTYRAIVDGDAFDVMMDSWEVKLNRISDEDQASNGLSGALLQQLAQAKKTLDGLDLPTGSDPLSRAVQDVPGPAFVLSPEGRVALTNTEGAAIFGARQGSFFDTARIDPRSLESYWQLMRSANQRSNRSQAILRLLPLEGDVAILAEAWLLTSHAQRGAFVVIRSLEIEWTDHASGMLAEAFGLSVAEGDVARLFYQLRDVREVASARGVSLLTARTQLKTVMAKTEAPSQVDLMRLLAMTAARAIQERRGAPDRWRDPLGREQVLNLPDGRRIAWTWMGDPLGRPVVLCRGLPMVYLLPPETEQRLVDAGIKLLALSRPGYGNSSLHAELSPLEDNLSALRSFLDRVVEDKCVAVGVNSGFVPLLAEAASNPKRFQAIICIGFSGVLDPSGIQRYQPIQKSMMRLASMTPWLSELLAKQGERMMDKHGVDWYIERAYRTRPLDHATCADPNLTPFIRNACAHMKHLAPNGFVRELILCGIDLDWAVKSLSIPVTWAAPKNDGIYDEGRYRVAEARNPNIRLLPIDDAGELVLYQQTTKIVDLIIQIANG